MSIVDRVKDLDLPLDQIIVIGSGLLDALEIRPTLDVDLAVSQAVFDELVTNPEWKSEQIYGAERLVRSDIEVWQGWDDARGRVTYQQLLEDSVVIDGVRFVSIEYLRSWKQWRSRDKDLRDIKLIDEYMSRND